MKLLERLKNKQKFILIKLNVLIVALVLLSSILYISNSHKEQEGSVHDKFTSTVMSMQKTSSGYIIAQQNSCNDWATFISASNFTMHEALDYIRTTNSGRKNGIMAHIISYEDYKGYSTVSRTNKTDDNGNELDYTDLAEDIVIPVRHAIENSDVANLTMTYTNPINSAECIGCCANITLLNENGEKQTYLLIRIIPKVLVLEQWAFPTGYEHAELSLINSHGKYIVRSDSMMGDSFFDYAKSYNSKVDNENSISEQILNNETVFIELKDYAARDFYIVSVKSSTSEDLYYIGYILKDNVEKVNIAFTMVIIVTIGFILLILVNGLHIISINKKLVESVEETKKANQAKSRFLSSMSHDIRTPMNAIVGMTTIASKHINEPEQVKECLSKISLASNHLLTLINDVLDISKVESGKMTLNPIVFSLSNSITNLVNITRQQIKEKGLEFSIHIHDINYEYLYGDELRLNQIFINILSNAVKYTNANGKVSIDLQEDLLEDGKNVVLTYIVEDTGIGMSEEFMKNMYQVFVRAVDTRVDKIQGSGLGLSITKQMVDLMDGSIDCQSKLGEGTKFTVKITLPIAERLTEDLMLPPIEMLVIDDDEMFLFTAESTLKEMGVKVDLAKSGAEAIDKIKERHAKGSDYPVIIIDWKMPEMNGLDVTKAIRSIVGKNVSIIIISSYDWTEIEEEAISVGANGFINKPIFKSTIYEKMNELLHFSAESEENKAADDLSLDGLHFLVAEDNDLNYEIIQEILATKGIKTTRAENGAICCDLLNAADKNTYDIVLMDIQMPIMNGYDATRKIRELEDEDKKNIPIIAMTADAFAEDIQACLKAGMNAHVAKPIDINKLFTEIHKIIQSKVQ